MPSVPCPQASRRWILAATILGSSMAFIDGTVVNIALPALQSQMNATILDVQWVVEAYALFLSALMLTGGALGDRLGRKRVYAAASRSSPWLRSRAFMESFGWLNCRIALCTSHAKALSR